MACFDQIIGLKELCTGYTPSSGIYLNDIGVSLDLVNSVITKEYTGPSDFVASKIDHAINEVKNEVYGYFAKDIKTRSVIDNGRIGYVNPNMTVVTGGGNRGIELSVYNNANYFSLEIAGIELFTDFTGTIPVKIYDVDQALLLDTVNVTSVAGEISSAFPHLKYQSNRKYLNLWIGYNATGINSYKTTTHKGQCCGVYHLTNSYVRAKGATATSYIESGLTQITDTAGMSINYSLVCDPYGWMCNFAQLLSLPIAYKVAADIYRTALMVTPGVRSNNSTTVNSEMMKANFEWHEMQYREKLNNILKRVYLPTDSICFQCEQPSSNAIILP